MNARKLAASLGFAAVLGFSLGSHGASAQTLRAGTPYGCTINSNAPGCTTPVPYTPPPSYLPSTGGAHPSAPGNPLLPVGGALSMVVVGAALRRRSGRRAA